MSQMSATYPLIVHTQAGAPLAWYQGRIVTAAQYLADVAALRQHLPPGRWVLNLCANRYAFLVGFGAAIVAGVESLLPATLTAGSLVQLRDFAPDYVILADQPLAFGAYDTLNPSLCLGQPLAADFMVPSIAADQLVAHIFTSGSTGQPVPHGKSWGMLVASVAGGGILPTAPYSMVGTTPGQHMYGFEFNVLRCLLDGAVLHDEKPFFPWDIATTLMAVPPPRVLVTTPFHLENLLDAAVVLPELAGVLSATAPLNRALAKRAETALSCPLTEIFGSTETGQIATRRPAHDDEWTLRDGVRIEQTANGFIAVGGHLANPVPLADRFDLTGAHTFRLLGRSSDMLNIVGKRESLGHLNRCLNDIAGVKDGVFFMPTRQHGKESRLAALFVSDTLTVPQVLAALRQSIDPVFLPRPLLHVAALPRNATGKMTQGALDELLAQAEATTVRPDGESRSRRWRIAADHPALPGHFPGDPLLPGVCLLDWVVAECGVAVAGIAQAKFLKPVRPGDEIDICYGAVHNDSLPFSVQCGTDSVCVGQLRLAKDTAGMAA